MASFNKVILLGNLTRDPEVRFTQSGTALCTFGLAVNRRYRTNQGEDREEVCFVDIEVWGKQAESCGNYLGKGAPALVEGRLRMDQWDDRDTGKKRSRILVRAERVQFVGGPAKDRQFNQGAPQQQQQGYGNQAQQNGAYAGAQPQQTGYQDVPPANGFQQKPAQQMQPPAQQQPPQMPPFESVDDFDDDIPF